MDTLRDLLIQRAARLQQRPAFFCKDWILDYGQLRNRVEGLAMGLLASPRPMGHAVFVPDPGPWGWMAELAAACCGLRWDAEGETLAGELLGGVRFNDERGRGPYHDRGEAMGESTIFTGNLTHGELLRRLARLNGRLGWDHETLVRLPSEALGTPGGRGALWSALYAGAVVRAETPLEPARPRRWSGSDPDPAFNPALFLELGL